MLKQVRKRYYRGRWSDFDQAQVKRENTKMDTDSLSDDVFEEDSMLNPKNFYQNTDTGLNISDSVFLDERTPSPTGYPNYRPPKEALQLYGLKAGQIHGDEGWQSYKIEEDNTFDDSVVHKVILF